MLSASIKYVGTDAESNTPCPALVQRWLCAEVDDQIEGTESSSPRLAAEKAIARFQALGKEPQEVQDEFIHLMVSRGFSDTRR